MIDCADGSPLQDRRPCGLQLQLRTQKISAGREDVHVLASEECLDLIWDVDSCFGAYFATQSYRGSEKTAMRRRYLFMFISTLLAAGGLLVLRDCARESYAVNEIEQNGAAISKPIPTVTVFVPLTGGGEKSFGNQQLLAILPYVDYVDRFAGISVRGTSVSDSSIAQLANVTALQTLDVGDTEVTASGLLQLRALPNLHQITISPGQLNETDRNRIKQAMPKVQIIMWSYPVVGTPASRPAR